ncbi:hypothetical protein GDO86_010943 [Hymenochirus boettgeri]|uniref:Uncharacterized protein n=1 Tax=Hymenochirus boettgeri TaxID=247094 RepID=A0A8T2JH78_9PIPI|nr:hypothetical protein GDO86_010943 [Hymenochirus boettgeri]
MREYGGYGSDETSEDPGGTARSVLVGVKIQRPSFPTNCWSLKDKKKSSRSALRKWS